MTTQRLFDDIRQKWVLATPEEIVRQSLVQKMIHELGYPKELIAVEKELSELPHLKARVGDVPQRRADLICFAKGISSGESLSPLLLIECKEHKITEAAREQVIGYNHFVCAPFVGVAARDGIEIGQFDSRLKTYQFVYHLPYFHELVSCCKN